MKSQTIASLLALVFLLLCASVSASKAAAAAAPNAMPEVINPAGRYLFFYHNYYVETKGVDGECKYGDILKAFADMGYVVVSEVRPKDTSVVEYAKKAAADVKKLLDAGVQPQNLVLAGHSKGGVIVLRVASLLEKPGVNYVVLAGCGIKGLEKGYPDFSSLKGNFLSLYATSDKVAGSCGAPFAQSGAGFSGKEVALESAAGHQLFFRPEELWVGQMFSWLNNSQK